MKSIYRFDITVLNKAGDKQMIYKWAETRPALDNWLGRHKSHWSIVGIDRKICIDYIPDISK